MDAPSDTAPDGRLPDGRFGPANRFGKGNAHARKMRELRGAVLEATTPRMVQQVIRRMMVSALKDGDTAAARIVLEYTLGKPAQAVELSGPDGEALGLDLGKLLALMREALADFPEAQIAVAARLRRLSIDAGRDVE